MTRYFSVLLSTFLAVVFLPPLAAGWEGTVSKVVDGDSIMVQRAGSVVAIRLYGIDTPEYRQPYSNKAKQFTRRLVAGEMVSVEEKDIDRYGRVVALVTCRGQLVNRELVRAGLAWYYPRYCREQPLCGELAALESTAKKHHTGLWRDADPVAPWVWKHQGKGRGSERQSGWLGWIRKWL